MTGPSRLTAFSRRAAAVALAIGFTARVVSADPVSVQSGAYTMEEDGGAAFNFMGDGLAVLGGNGTVLGGVQSYGLFEACLVATCGPGTPMNLSSEISGSLGHSGFSPTTVNGVTYTSTVYYSGDFRFSAPTVTAPSTTVPAAIPVTAPFTFSGQLLGFDDPSLTGPALFDVGLTGNGTFRGAVSTTTSPTGEVIGLTAVPDFAYQFSATQTSPTPEPSSVLLLGIGFAGTILRRFRI